MIDWGYRGWMQTAFDIVRLWEKIFTTSYVPPLMMALKRHYMVRHVCTWIQLSENYSKDIFKYVPPFDDQKRREEMQVINRNQKNPHLLLVRDARHTEIFDTGRAFEHFTRQVKETCVLNHCTRLTWVS